ncbi:ABC transporter substrate-binding protein [Yimella sp. cx-573]|nr:ABC transporter substrate-binding protein [Yimella sp. cx-573]
MIAARTARSAAALTLALAGSGTVSFVAAPAEHAAGYDGMCKDANGTTVVVDFQALGGGLVIRCAPNIPPGSTGLDALKLAGVPYAGVARWGDAFICRLYNRPSASETIPVAGMPGYKEACINTPPAKAYWSYWWAENGGTWQYSQWGVKNRNAIKGGFEAWSFSLNATATTNPQPRLRPLRPTATTPPPTSSSSSGSASASGSARPPSATATAGSTTSGSPAAPPAAGTPQGSGRPGSPGQGASSNGSSGTPAAPGTSGAAGGANPAATEHATATSLPPSLAAKEPSSAAASKSSSAPAGATSPSGANASGGPAVAAGVQVADSDKLAREAKEQTSSSLNTATVLGAGVLTFLAVLGAGTALRRRRRS